MGLETAEMEGLTRDHSLGSASCPAVAPKARKQFPFTQLFPLSEVLSAKGSLDHGSEASDSMGAVQSSAQEERKLVPRSVSEAESPIA